MEFPRLVYKSSDIFRVAFTQGQYDEYLAGGWYDNPSQVMTVNVGGGFDAHAANTNNPHNVTKAQISLGNVDNTSDLAKPVSTAIQLALDGKSDVGHVHAGGGSGVTDHTLLTNIGTNTHTQIDSHISSTLNPHNVTKSQVGLGNVDNTSDLSKPVSTATQTALDGKSDVGHTHLGGGGVTDHTLLTSIGVRTHAQIDSELDALAAPSFITITLPYTMVSQTGAQKIFNTTANGAANVGIGTYTFQCMLSLTALSSSTSSFGFSLGGTWVGTQTWCSVAKKGTLVSAATGQTTINTGAATSITTAGTSTNGHAYIRGLIRVSAAGTLIPQFSQTAATAAIVGVGSYFSLARISVSDTFAATSDWS